MLSHFDEYVSSLSVDFAKKISDSGFVVEDNCNELESLERKFYLYRNKKVLNLMILTTYDCNFSCWYCVQKHINSYLSVDTGNKIKKHIASYIEDNRIEHLTLSWFGGEPLMNFHSINEISTFAKNFCARKKIGFNCNITTNGSLLSDKIIHQMALLAFDGFQITIDGNQEHHNKTRFNDSVRDSFSLILGNIVALSKALPHANITVRINYTNKNLTPVFVEQLDSHLQSVKKNVLILFRKIWQLDETNDMDERLWDVVSQLSSLGYHILNDYDSMKLA